jgi:Stress up-regulated Nod 19
VPRRIKTLMLAGAAALALSGTAQAGVQTLVFRSQPITLKPFEVVQPTQLADSPKLDGYVVGMAADVVDAKGAVLPLNRVMLHHVVFAKLGVPDSTCAGRSPIPAERFYATGEERTKVQLPAGYGYPNLGSNLWGMLAMLMNHHNKRETVYVRYTVRYETSAPLVPVKPIWLDEHNCSADPVFDVPGTGGRGSTFSKHTDYAIPESGRLVEGVGHLHGGGIRLDLSDRTCGRRVFSSLPTWGGPEPKPVMHEPGPAHMSWFRSSTGIPVASGHVLRLKAVYDNSLPHTRVMGIMLLYLAPGQVTGCPAVPPLDIDLGSPGPPPRVHLPLLRRPRGPVRHVKSTWVGDYRYGAQRVSIRRGTRFRWHFVGGVAHNVTLASGPVGFSSPSKTRGTFSYRFRRPGVYKLFCSLHPTRMTQKIRVR